MNTLQSARLRLEPLMVHHAEAMFEGLRDEILYQWTDDQPPESLDWLRARYARLERRCSPDGREVWLNWAIAELPHGVYRGYVQATLIGTEASVAYMLFRRAWGKGLAREAVTLMIEELQVAHGVTRLHAIADSRNEKSLRLLAALGFTRSGDGGERSNHDLTFHRHLQS